MFKKPVLAEAGSPSSKAAAFACRVSESAPHGARGAYFQYVSTAQWRERRWRLFSTFPNKKKRGHRMDDETFFILRGAPRACVDFCDPTAVSRLSSTG